MPSKTWEAKRDDERLRTNLYRSLSRVMITLARIPLPRIGAFRVDDHGRLRLDNRPLSFDFVMMENEGIPLDIPRDATYSAVDAFVLDILSTFDRRLLHQTNGVSSAEDTYHQIAGLTASRAAIPQILERKLRHGPFIFTMTDLHQSNILVDSDWNITKFIDLEFCCSYPLECQQPPYWLTNQGVDQIDEGENGQQHARFVDVLTEEEEKEEGKCGEHQMVLSSTLRQAWKSGAFWAGLALTSPSGFTNLFYRRILSFLGLSKIPNPACYRVLIKLWQPSAFEIVKRKVNDLEVYERELEEAFAEKGERAALKTAA